MRLWPISPVLIRHSLSPLMIQRWPRAWTGFGKSSMAPSSKPATPWRVYDLAVVHWPCQGAHGAPRGHRAGIMLTVALLAALGAFLAQSTASMTRHAVAGVPVDWQVQLVPGTTAQAIV